MVAARDRQPDSGDGQAGPARVPDYYQGAAELRTDELMKAAAGLPVPGLDSLKDLRFPEEAQR